MSVQIIENWSRIAGIVRTLQPSTEVKGPFTIEHVEPWSYMKFTYLKPRGWKNFEEGPDTSIYSVAPLARLNASDGMATPKAQAAYDEFFKTLGGKVVHPVLGLPGGVSKALDPAELPKFKQLAKEGVEFAEWTLAVIKKIVLGNPDYVKMITSDAFTHKTCYMGMVDEKNKVNFYDGKLRVVDCTGREIYKFSPQQYRDFVAEHVEPWSYMKFTYLKPRGWKN